MTSSMRRLSLLLALLPALALVPSAGSAGAATAAAEKSLSFTVMSYVRVVKPHDFPPKKKENRGDFLEIRSVLASVGPIFNVRKAKVPVGWDTATLVYLNDKGKARLRGKAIFRGQGTLLYRGVMKDLPGGRTSVPIVNGSGKFRGAKGVLVIGPGELKATNTFRLKLPGVITA
jgi:hypothetical protein